VDGVALLAGTVTSIPSTHADAEAGPEEAAPEPGAPSPGVWPSEAIRLLDQADQRIRAGDWEGFGTALDELRSFLEGIRGPGR